MSDLPHGDEPPRPSRETFAEPGGQPIAEAPRPGLISSSSAPGSTRASQVWAESSATAEESAETAEPLPPPSPTIELSDTEARVLGSMIEKSYLTPDVYPMTTNALVTACNQKTNRDPVVAYSAVHIDSALLELRQRNLVRRVHTPGSRSTKHRQTLDEALSLDDRQLALVSVLLLRGPQTIPELRLRTERHDVGFDDLDAVQRCLDGLRTRSKPLVCELPREPGQRENRWQHLLVDPAALATDASDADSDADMAGTSPRSASPPTHSPPTHSAPTHSAPTQSASTGSPRAAATPTSPPPAGDLANRVGVLETQVATLQRQLASLADKLGEPLE